MVVPCFSKEQTSAPLDYGLSKQARECWDNKDIPGATRNLLAFFKPRAAVFRMTGSGAPFWDVVSDSLQEVGEGETSAMFWNESWNEGGDRRVALRSGTWRVLPWRGKGSLGRGVFQSLVASGDHRVSQGIAQLRMRLCDGREVQGGVHGG